MICHRPYQLMLKHLHGASFLLGGNQVIHIRVGCCVNDPVGEFFKMATKSSFISSDIMPYHNGTFQQTLHLKHCFIIMDAIAVIFPCNPRVLCLYVNPLVTSPFLVETSLFAQRRKLLQRTLLQDFIF